MRVAVLGTVSYGHHAGHETGGDWAAEIVLTRVGGELKFLVVKIIVVSLCSSFLLSSVFFSRPSVTALVPKLHLSWFMCDILLFVKCALTVGHLFVRILRLMSESGRCWLFGLYQGGLSDGRGGGGIVPWEENTRLVVLLRDK